MFWDLTGHVVAATYLLTVFIFQSVHIIAKEIDIAIGLDS